MIEISEDEFKELRRDVENARAEAERAKGAVEQLTKRLKDEFDCSNLKEAKALLETLQEDTVKAEREFTKALTEYRKKWKDGD
jgi:hypothetical protein